MMRVWINMSRFHHSLDPNRPIDSNKLFTLKRTYFFLCTLLLPLNSRCELLYILRGACLCQSDTRAVNSLDRFVSSRQSQLRRRG